MRIRKLINRLFKRENPYHRRTMELMDELSPEELRTVVIRIQELQKQGKGA